MVLFSCSNFHNSFGFICFMSIFPTLLHVYSVYHSQQYSIFIESVKKYFFQTFQSHRYHINIETGWEEFVEYYPKRILYFREIRVEGAEGI